MPCGDQPSARPTTLSSATCRISTPSTPSVFAASSPGRDSGVVPSRRSTPYRRSKPVPIAWPVNAVDITARASTPGTRKSTRGFGSVERSARLANRSSSTVGMTTVRSSCSPLRSISRSSIAVCARSCRARRCRSGRGRQVERYDGHDRSPWPVRSRKTSSSVRPPVVSRSAMTPRPAHQAGHGGERRSGSIVAVDQVVARGRLAAPRSGWQRGEQLVERQARRSVEAQLARASLGAAVSAGGRAGGDHPAAVDDHDLVGELLGLVHRVRA